MKVKAQAIFPPEKGEGEIETLWGVDFTVVGEDRIADLPKDEAEAMIACGRAKKVGKEAE